jgi:acetyl esterase
MQSLTYLIILGVISLGMGASLEAKEMKRRTIRWHAEEDPRPIETHIYKQVDGMDLRMLVVKPDGWQRQQKRPAMVWVHGGGFTGGSPEAFLPSARYSAARGAVGLSIQYRLMKSPGYKDDATLSERENAVRRAEKYTAFLEGPSLTDLIEDCAEAIHVLRTHSPEFGIDPNRITVIGDSAGAYLAAALGTMVEGDARANAVICGSSISDLTSGFGREYVKPGDGAKKKLEEDPERMDRAKNRSPLFNISDNGTAFLILAGTNDWLGEEPRRFHEALKAKGVDAEFVNYLGARHAFILYGYSASDEQITQSLLDMDRFLLQRGLLDGPSALAMPEDAVRTPNPPVPLPEGATGLTFDCHGNFWTLVSEIVHVLPAGTQAWIKDELSGIPDGRWRIILADDNGYLWISDNRRVLCMDPRKPEKGWIVVSENPEFPASSGITRLNNAMSGGVYRHL